MSTAIQAVFENGVLRPLAALDLKEGQTVQVVIAPSEKAEPQDPASILGAIAAMPIEGSGDSFTSRDHDHVLYHGYTADE